MGDADTERFGLKRALRELGLLGALVLLGPPNPWPTVQPMQEQLEISAGAWPLVVATWVLVVALAYLAILDVVAFAIDGSSG
jgi:hypothetical protein